jgi:hypothetical protein
MANNPLDYLIKDPNAMRYALLQDAGYKGGGAVRMEGGGSARAEDDDAPPPGFRYVYFGDPAEGASGRYPVPIETPTAEPSRDLVGASAAPSLPTAEPELQPEPSTAIAPHRYAPGEVPGGPAPEPTLDQMRYELARSNLTPVDWLAGAGENALSLLTAPLGMLGGYAGLGYHMLRGAPLNEANARAADWARATSYQPTTLAGQEIAEDYVNPILAKLPPVVSGINARALQVPKGTTGVLTAGVKRDVNQFSNDVYNAQRGITPGYPTAGTEFQKAFVEPRPTVYDMLAGLEPSNIPSSASAAVMSDPAAPKPAKVLAPANEQGFYSPTEAAALNLQRKSGSGQALLNDILKGENVRAEEVSGMGLDTFLKDKKNVTAAEVQDYIAQNKLGLGEGRYGGKAKGSFLEFLKEKGYPDDEALRILNKAEDGSMDGRGRTALRTEYLDIREKPTKFKRYSLPGGQNYREVVLTLPEKQKKQTWEWFDPETQESKSGFGTQQEAYDARPSISAIVSKIETQDSPQSYRSSHFDEPNILAHLRMSDRVTDGKKTLLVDEVQSDWHQAARDLRTAEVNRLVADGMSKDQAQKAVPKDYGYGPIMEKSVEAYYETKDGQRIPIGFGKTKEEAEANIDAGWKNLVDIKYETHERKVKEGVPDAPYKDDYYQLALRRAIKEAVDGGYDRVALPTGARVAERFSLTKHINELHYSGSNLKAYDHNGNEVISQTGVRPEDLPSYVGREIANKLLEQPKQGTLRSLVGQDLTVGDEGMKKYYDEIYPTYLKKFGKKYGSTVGTAYAKTDIQEWHFPIQIESDGKNFWLFGQDPRIDKKAKLSSNFSSYEDANKFRDSMYEGNTEPLHYMDITPAMRKEFSTGIHMRRGGIVHKAQGGQVKQPFTPPQYLNYNIDHMRHELMRQG